MTADEFIEHSATFRVPASHPALAGHFPGNPIVPGVVLLDAVISAAETWLATSQSVRGLRQAKFLAPLRPEETTRIGIVLRKGRLDFTVTRDGTTIASGTFEVAAETAP